MEKTLSAKFYQNIYSRICYHWRRRESLTFNFTVSCMALGKISDPNLNMTPIFNKKFIKKLSLGLVFNFYFCKTTTKICLTSNHFATFDLVRVTKSSQHLIWSLHKWPEDKSMLLFNGDFEVYRVKAILKVMQTCGAQKLANLKHVLSDLATLS
jgi:hypothetical protein